MLLAVPAGTAGTHCLNPSVQIRAIPTEITPITPSVRGRCLNPSVQIRAIPTPYNKLPDGRYVYNLVSIHQYRSGEIRRGSGAAQGLFRLNSLIQIRAIPAPISRSLLTARCPSSNSSIQIREVHSPSATSARYASSVVAIGGVPRQGCV
jgi:hypothetical protein